MNKFLQYVYIVALIGLVSNTEAIAQPVVNAGNYGGAVGNRFRFDSEDLTALPAIATGAGASWSYTFRGGLPISLSVLPYAQGVGRDSFPQQSLVFRASIPFVDSSDGYIGSVANGLYFYGNAEANSYSVIKGGQMLLPYGLTLGQTTSYSHLEYVTNIGMDTSIYRLDDTLTYSGYGTLNVNGRSYQNTVLIKRVSKSYAESNGQFSLEDETTDNMFYAPGVGFPVLILEKYVDYMSSVPSEDYVANFANNVVLASAPRLPQLELSVYPNPTQDRLTLKLPQAQSVTLTAVITDLKGTQVANLPIAADNHLDISTLPAGLYILTVQSDQGVYRSKVSKQ